MEKMYTRDASPPLVVFVAGRPHCEKHGAMLQVNIEGNLYRCAECGVGLSTAGIFTMVEGMVMDAKLAVRRLETAKTSKS